MGSIITARKARFVRNAFFFEGCLAEAFPRNLEECSFVTFASFHS
jgi:hypothetical protein